MLVREREGKRGRAAALGERSAHMSAGGACFSPLARCDPDMRRLRARRPSDPPWFTSELLWVFFLNSPWVVFGPHGKEKAHFKWTHTSSCSSAASFVFVGFFFYNIANIVVVSLLRQKIQTIRRR